MICPACNKTMIVVEYRQIELDYCPGCKGVWFDSVELELLLHTLELGHEHILSSQMLKTGEVKARGKKRRCPICRKTMKLVNVGDKEEIIIDACGRGDGLWFDGGELPVLLKEKAVKDEGSAATQRVVQFLGEVFQA